MAIVAAVISALNIPVDKGFKELEDKDNIEKTAGYREIHTVFEPVWGTRWFHFIMKVLQLMHALACHGR